MTIGSDISGAQAPNVTFRAIIEMLADLSKTLTRQVNAIIRLAAQYQFIGSFRKGPATREPLEALAE